MNCDRCQVLPRYGQGNRYCKECAKAVLKELKENGYLTPAPMFTGSWSGAARTGEQRENVYETKHGRDG